MYRIGLCLATDMSVLLTKQQAREEIESRRAKATQVSYILLL